MYTRENEKSCGRENSRRVRVCAMSTDEPSLGLSTAPGEFRSCTLIVLSSSLSLASIVGEVEIAGQENVVQTMELGNSPVIEALQRAERVKRGRFVSIEEHALASQERYAAAAKIGLPHQTR